MDEAQTYHRFAWLEGTAGDRARDAQRGGGLLFVTYAWSQSKVGKGGFEPPRREARDPKSRSSANSDTSPPMHYTPVDKQQANVDPGLGTPKA
jgi:hypothetical protein